MIAIALGFAYICFGTALLCNVLALLRPASLPDRVLALDTMVINMIALIVLAGIQRNSGMNFEAALLLAMTGFVSTVAYCKFMLRGDIIE